MNMRRSWLGRIYELVKVESRELTLDQLAEELGISYTYLSKLSTYSKDHVEEIGWMMGAVDNGAIVTVWDGNESAPNQREPKAKSIETAKRRCQRAIHVVYHQVDLLVKEMGIEHPERAFWETQRAYAMVMKEAAERANQ